MKLALILVLCILGSIGLIAVGFIMAHDAICISRDEKEGKWR